MPSSTEEQIRSNNSSFDGKTPISRKKFPIKNKFFINFVIKEKHTEKLETDTDSSVMGYVSWALKKAVNSASSLFSSDDNKSFHATETATKRKHHRPKKPVNQAANLSQSFSGTGTAHFSSSAATPSAAKLHSSAEMTRTLKENQPSEEEIKEYIIKYTNFIMALLEPFCRDLHALFSDGTAPSYWAVRDENGQPIGVACTKEPGYDAQTIKKNPLTKDDLVIESFIECISDDIVTLDELRIINSQMLQRKEDLVKLSDDAKLDFQINDRSVTIKARDLKNFRLNKQQIDAGTFPLSIPQLDAINTYLLDNKIDLNSTLHEERISVPLDGKVIHIRARDIKNYRIIKAQAEIHTIAYVLAEDDLHWRNLAALLRIDFDMFLWIITEFFKENGLIDAIARSAAGRFPITPEDIIKLPCLDGNGTRPFFFPTQATFYTDYQSNTVKTILSTVHSYLSKNLYSKEQSEVFASLENNPIYNYHKYKTLLRMQIIDSKHYGDTARMHVDEDTSSANLPESHTFYEKDVKLKNRPLVDVMSELLDERLKSQLNKVLMKLPYMTTEMARYGEIHFNTISQALIKRNNLMMEKNEKNKAKAQAYQLDLLSNVINGEIESDPDMIYISVMQPGVIYLSNINGQLAYSVVGLDGQEKKEIPLSIPAPTPLTVENLEALKQQILAKAIEDCNIPYEKYTKENLFDIEDLRFEYEKFYLKLLREGSESANKLYNLEDWSIDHLQILCSMLLRLEICYKNKTDAKAKEFFDYRDRLFATPSFHKCFIQHSKLIYKNLVKKPTESGSSPDILKKSFKEMRKKVHEQEDVLELVELKEAHMADDGWNKDKFYKFITLILRSAFRVEKKCSFCIEDQIEKFKESIFEESSFKTAFNINYDILNKNNKSNKNMHAELNMYTEIKAREPSLPDAFIKEKILGFQNEIIDQENLLKSMYVTPNPFI